MKPIFDKTPGEKHAVGVRCIIAINPNCAQGDPVIARLLKMNNGKIVVITKNVSAGYVYRCLCNLAVKVFNDSKKKIWRVSCIEAGEMLFAFCDINESFYPRSSHEFMQEHLIPIGGDNLLTGDSDQIDKEKQLSN